MALVIFKFGGLWLHANFRKLWAGQAASSLATQLTGVALPLVAVVFLNASPIQMGVIGAMGGVPAIVGIYLGVWVDRRRRSSVLALVDFARLLMLISIPVAYVLDVLSIEFLYFISLGIGGSRMLFEIAYRSFLPSVVRRSELIEGNSKLELGNSGATAAGPGIGGALIEIVAAPFAMFAGAVLYLISASMFRSMKVKESVTSRSTEGDGNGESTLDGMKAGFSFFRKNRPLLGIAAASATIVLFGTAYDVIYILYLVRNHDFTPAMIGLIFSLGSIGMFTASFVSNALMRRVGLGPGLILGFLVMGLGGYLVPLAEGSRSVVFVVIILAEITFIVGVTIWNIGQVSLRQAVTPPRFLGRLSSIQVVMENATLPIGAMIGGFLGEYLGLRQAIFIFAGGILAGGVWLFVFGIWKIREMPDSAGD